MTDPFVGQLTFFRVYSGHLDAGSAVFNSTKDTHRAHRPPAEDAREQARGDQGSLRGRHRRGRRAQERDDRRHALRRDKPIVLESMNFPEPVISVAIEPKTKADQEKLGMALAEADAGGSDVPRADRPGDGPDDHPRHGRAAPRDHRRPPEARVQRRRERRQAAGRLPGNDHARGRRATGDSSARRAAAASTATARSGSSPAEEGTASSSRTTSSAARSRRNSSSRSSRASRKRSRRGVLAGYPDDDVHVELYDGSYHDVDSSEMAFKIAGSMAFQDAAKKARPVLWSRSCTSRSWCPRATWAT